MAVERKQAVGFRIISGDGAGRDVMVDRGLAGQDAIGRGHDIDPIAMGDGKFLVFAENGTATVEDQDGNVIETFYDPFAEDAVVKIFATGVRNAYDLVWHSNGQLYVPTNGSAAGGGVRRM